MTEIITVMQWPLLACLLLPGMLVYLGLHIVRREIIFVDLALAQVAALGTTLALLVGYDAHDWQTFAFSVAFTFIGAVIFTLTRGEAHARVPQEALIGIVYVVSAALGMLLLSRTAEGNEELRRTLIGDVLLVSSGQVWKTFALYLAIAVLHFIFRKKFLALSFESVHGAHQDFSQRLWDFWFYVLFGLVVTSFVQIGGVLLVFSYLIIPAVCANFVAEKLGPLLLTGWITATVSSVAGLYLSYAYDLPTGAAVVCTLGAALLMFIAAAKIGRIA